MPFFPARQLTCSCSFARVRACAGKFTPNEMPKVQGDGFQGILFHRAGRMHVEVLVLQLAERDVLRYDRRGLFGWLSGSLVRLAVADNEGQDLDAVWHLHALLL